MVNVDDSLSSALDLIKRFADDWMQVSDAIDCEDLAALVDALDRLKKDAEQKLSIKKATQTSIESNWQPTHTGSANQGIRRSHRIASAPRVASAGSLFVTEQDTESESSNEDDIPSRMLPEASPDEHTTMNAVPGVLFDDPALLPVYYENQAPTEKLYRTAMLQERHAIEQESPSSTLYTTRPVVDGQDERTEVQPVQVHDGASDAQAHQAPSTDTQYQAAGDLEYIEHQPGPESPHRSSVNHPRQDATISPCDEFDFGEVAMHDLPTPQFFNEAFEDGGFSTLHHGAQTDVEEATAYSGEQHSMNQDHTETFGDDLILQSYDSQYQAADGLDYIGNQPGPESPHRSSVNHPRQDATISPCDEFDFGEVAMHDLPTPQFFNEAFEDGGFSTLHHGAQTDVEEATAYSGEQHSMNQDHTETFGDDLILQSYDSQYQAADGLDYIGNQPGPESPHRSSVNHPRQDATISPCDEFDFGEVAMHDLPTPQFFNEAFEDGGFSTLHHGAQTDVEEATAYSGEQHSMNQDHTETFGDDLILQSYDSQYQAADGLDYIGNQPGPESPHRSSVNHPRQDATISPCDEFDFGEVAMHDLPTPQFFNEAFEDGVFSTLHHGAQTDVEEVTADSYEQHRIDPDHTKSFGDDPIVQGYLDLACRSSFRLPHEPVEDADHLDARELLLPLVEEKPLTSRLIHGLLYTLLPGPLRIFEVCSSTFDPEPSPEEAPVDDFVAIVRRNGEALPLLVLGIETSKTLFVLESETMDLPSLEISWLIRPEWSTEHIDPRCIEPQMESTLLSLWIAEACFQYRPLRNVPSSRDLRLRFLRELLAPFQRDSVLEKCGIPRTHTVSQDVDTRDKFARLETQVQNDKIFGLDVEIFVQNLENFEPGALRKALLERPSKIKDGRCLRILQCVDEIGSPHILDSLKLACAREDENQSYRAIKQPIFEKLFHIHIHLDKQESQSHLLVARKRYIKYCYFETYLRAVEALKGEKHNGYRERQKVLARKRTASFKKGISEELPPTPHTDEIHRVYKNLSPSARRRKAPDIVKDEISSKVAKLYGGNEKSIRRNINKYIKQGRVLHHILRVRRSLDPGLLVLFPSFGAGPPSLSMAEFGLELQGPEEKSLSKPIELKDIDGLTLDEGAWFGEVLQARPELLEHVPNTVLDLISDSLTHDLDIRERDPDSFRDRPLQFLT